VTPAPNFTCERCGRAIGHDKLCPYFKDIASDHVEESEGEETEVAPPEGTGAAEAGGD
jgi:hypothetical protein